MFHRSISQLGHGKRAGNKGQTPQEQVWQMMGVLAEFEQPDR
jgi:hypothetical protein